MRLCQNSTKSSDKNNQNLLFKEQSGKIRVSTRKTFAQFLRKKAQIFSFVALHFCKLYFAQKMRKSSQKNAWAKIMQILRKKCGHFVETLGKIPKFFQLWTY